MLRLIVFSVAMFLFGLVLSWGIPTALSQPDTLINLAGAIGGAVGVAGFIVSLYKGGLWVLKGKRK